MLQSAQFRDICARPKTKKNHNDPRRPGENRNRSFRNKTSKRSIFKAKLGHFVKDRTQKSQIMLPGVNPEKNLAIMLGLLNYAKNYASTIDKLPGMVW